MSADRTASASLQRDSDHHGHDKTGYENPHLTGESSTERGKATDRDGHGKATKDTQHAEQPGLEPLSGSGRCTRVRACGWSASASRVGAARAIDGTCRSGVGCYGSGLVHGLPSEL